MSATASSRAKCLLAWTPSAAATALNRWAICGKSSCSAFLAYIWSLWLALASPTKAVCTLFAVLSFMFIKFFMCWLRSRFFSDLYSVVCCSRSE